MSIPPLTHHEIVRQAAPLTRRGIKVNLAACNRSERYIEFHSQPTPLVDSRLTYSLQVGRSNLTLLTRILAHGSGAVSTLSVVVKDVNAALDVFEDIPLARQLVIQDNHVQARSYSLESKREASGSVGLVSLRFVCARVAGVELRVDTSTGGAMPADVRLLIQGQRTDFLRETLADGEDSPLLHRAARSLVEQAAASTVNRSDSLENGRSQPDFRESRKVGMTNEQVRRIRRLPDDILAVLGPQWRPLINQGDHWKGVLRQLGQGAQRTKRAESRIQVAIDHLHDTLSQPPEQYHVQHQKSRWRVYIRRLQPVMLFLGILALMPISWLFVSEGGVQMHPLALGLTPLLMVGVVALTAREIPVMEIPPRPAPLNAETWSIAPGSAHTPASFKDN